MKRLFWFGLGLLAGARLHRKVNSLVAAFAADPIRELDRWVRLLAPVVQRSVRAARSTIED